MENLHKCEANFAALTPITFLKRAAMVYADRNSIIYGDTKFTWRQTYSRCCRLASSLQSLGVGKNDVVSVLAPNIPALYEMHFAVPMVGAVLNTINTMLDANIIKTILHHSEAKILFVDYEYLSKVCDAFRILKADPSITSKRPSVVIINEPDSPVYNVAVGGAPVQDFVSGSSLPMSQIDYHPLNIKRSHKLDYEQLILLGNQNFVALSPADEWDPIALNYTSGTTSAPKGVVYSHRGAYLSTLSMLLGWEMGTSPIYLWSLPMFHCNGWTFTWGIAARGGTNVCIRKTTGSAIYRSIALHGVTHMCCAPVVFNMLREVKHEQRVNLRSRVQILTGGAPPPAALLEEMEQLGFHVVHAYGLTEATGPALLCEWQSNWDQLPQDEQARLRARQGISVLSVADVDVKDLVTKESVPRDGKKTGEIVIRGSGIMKGYFKNEEATSEAFENGWFHTGDVGVIYPDGYVEIKDRKKDVIISGGENISSVELENVIFQHSKVAEAAVVAMPHPQWGESPCAFVVKKSLQGDDVTEEEIITHCRSNLPHFMEPKKVVFVKALPRNANGKVEKMKLRAFTKKFEVQPSGDHHQAKQTTSSQPLSGLVGGTGKPRMPMSRL